MARRGPDAAELERQKLARQRFRNLIRSVVYNRIWLNEDDEKKISMNVKRNVAMLVRPRHKIGVLTMAEKGLIRTPHVLRTVAERKILLKLITGLKCFQTIPPQVRARLIPVIKFANLEAGRKIIKEGGYADTVYFILYGEVEASRNVFDTLKRRYVDKSEFIFSSGDCIGEIEMIEGCLRKHTYTAISTVEVLVIFGHDFNEILKSIMTKQWYEKKAAIKTLGYFDHFNEEQLISANKLSMFKEFDALETIYHEDLGEASHAYFVLSGECMILQSLQLKVTEKRFSKTFELLDVSQTKKTDSSQDEAKEKMATAAEGIKTADIDRDSVGSNEYSDEDMNQIDMILQTLAEKTQLKSSENSPVVSEIKESELSLNEEEIHAVYQEMEEFDNAFEEGLLTSEGKYYDTENINETTSQRDGDSKFKGVEAYSQEKVSEEHIGENVQETEKILSSVRKNKKSFVSSTSHSSSTQKVSGLSKSSKTIERVSFERRFIDVGSLTFGAIIGLGEKIEDRVIMARTKVQCLLIPRYWLFEKDQNPGRIWQRRRFAVDTGIPSRWQLYKDFLKTRKWQKYKNNFISSIIDSESISNPTHYQDIPMMFHIINPVEE